MPEEDDMTDPLRAALDILDVIDGIVDDTHPEGDGCPLCIALDDLRAHLAAPLPRVYCATLTLSPRYGAGIWLDRRLVARIDATIEDSRTTKDEPVPRWERDARALVDAANRGFALAAATAPLDDDHYDGCPRCEHCACAGVTRKDRP